jgi:hypothetical protein
VAIWRLKGFLDLLMSGGWMDVFPRWMDGWMYSYKFNCSFKIFYTSHGMLGHKYAISDGPSPSVNVLLGIESASRLLIILVIMTMQFGWINAFNKMCVGLKE